MSNFQTLDALALDTVTGGAAKSSSSSSEVTSALTNIQSSITDLSKNNNKKGLFGNSTNAMLFAMVAMKNQQQSPSNVVLVR